MKLTDDDIVALRDVYDDWRKGQGTDYYRIECIQTLATEALKTRALLASFDEERLEEIITDSIDLDWTPRDAARAIVRAMKGASDE
jgi:hypothetical protein